MATFGKTSNGASTTLHNANRKVLSQATLSEDALLTSMTIRARTNNTTQTKHWKPVIYTDNSGTPDALVVTGVEGSLLSTSVASYTANFAGESLSAGTYWIGMLHDGDTTTNFIFYRDNTATSAKSNTDTYSGGAADPAGTMADLAGKIDSYVTYTPDTATTASGMMAMF